VRHRKPVMHKPDTRATDFLAEITGVVLTFNESPNIGRTLGRLADLREVVVVDSGSTDDTLRIVQGFPNARVVSLPFDQHATQWNFAVRDTGIRTEWVLALDADYVVTDEFLDELRTLCPTPDVSGYWASFRYCIHGRRLSGTLYPPVVALYRRQQVEYVQDGHTQRARVSGAVQKLSGRIEHDDRKPLARWLASQSKYATLEAELLKRKGWGELSIQDRLRRMIVITPWLVPLYCLTIKRGLLDGRAGLYYALQRSIAETILALRLLESKLHSTTSE
jgi:glycosyltransferase involved in cell wall biosynthesis